MWSRIISIEIWCRRVRIFFTEQYDPYHFLDLRKSSFWLLNIALVFFWLVFLCTYVCVFSSSTFVDFPTPSSVLLLIHHLFVFCVSRCRFYSPSFSNVRIVSLPSPSSFFFFVYVCNKVFFRIIRQTKDELGISSTEKNSITQKEINSSVII